MNSFCFDHLFLIVLTYTNASFCVWSFVAVSVYGLKSATILTIPPSATHSITLWHPTRREIRTSVPPLAQHHIIYSTFSLSLSLFGVPFVDVDRRTPTGSRYEFLVATHYYNIETTTTTTYYNTHHLPWTGRIINGWKSERDGAHAKNFAAFGEKHGAGLASFLEVAVLKVGGGMHEQAVVVFHRDMTEDQTQLFFWCAVTSEITRFRMDNLRFPIFSGVNNNGDDDDDNSSTLG